MFRRYLVFASALFIGCGFIVLRPLADEWLPRGAAPERRELVGRQPCANREPLRQALFGDLHMTAVEPGEGVLGWR